MSTSTPDQDRLDLCWQRVIVQAGMAQVALRNARVAVTDRNADPRDVARLFEDAAIDWNHTAHLLRAVRNEAQFQAARAEKRDQENAENT